MSIGENIRQRRVECGMQMIELAEKVGVSHSMICQVERGSKMPNMALGKQIAEVLECKMEDLMK